MGTGSPRKPLQIPNPTQAGELTPDPLPCPHFQAAGRRPPWFPVLKVIQNKDTFFRFVLKTSPSGLWAFFFPPPLSCGNTRAALQDVNKGGFLHSLEPMGSLLFPSTCPRWWGSAGFHSSRWDPLLQEFTWTQQTTLKTPPTGVQPANQPGETSGYSCIPAKFPRLLFTTPLLSRGLKSHCSPPPECYF